MKENRTDAGNTARDGEWPWPEADHIKGTALTKEVPVTPENPEHYEYPFSRSSQCKTLSSIYKKLASAIPDVLFCGRLGEYRYLDMDEAIGRAFILAEKIMNNRLNPTAK